LGLIKTAKEFESDLDFVLKICLRKRKGIFSSLSLSPRGPARYARPTCSLPRFTRKPSALFPLAGSFTARPV